MGRIDIDRIKSAVARLLRQAAPEDVLPVPSLESIRAHRPPRAAPRRMSASELQEQHLLRRVRDALHGKTPA